MLHSGVVTRKLPFGFAKRQGLVVTAISESLAVVQCRQGVKKDALLEVQRFLRIPVQFQIIEDKVFDDVISLAYQNDSSASMLMVEGLGKEMDLASLIDAVPETEDLLEQEDDAPIIRLINALLTEAIREQASDIHIETFERRLVVRMRIDGVLREIVQPRRELAPLLVSRIKVMAKMDIAEKRVPQDGRISLKVGGKEVDVRVSTLPSNNGERVVMRLLDKQAGRLDISHLGMNPVDQDAVVSLVQKPHGIILVTGPTGSGKTTSLYAMLTRLNDQTRNILTVEDPIEYQIEGVGQTQVNTKAEMTFARGLRAILRQDPDVVMVGEIRDMETAEIAIQASLTGHLVLSTLHTNTAVGAVTRLQDMGIEPFLISSSLIGVMAQRLVRVLCVACRIPYKPDDSEYRLLELNAKTNSDLHLYHAKGCEKCKGTGYRGRTGIYEVILVDNEIRTMIHNRIAEIEIDRYARTRSPSIRSDGLRKIIEGITTVEEVLRVTRENE